MKHVMLDLETLGTRPGSVILSIGAVFFDLDGTTGETFYRNIDPQTCAAVGLTVDPQTYAAVGLTVDPQTKAWWMRQSQAARDALAIDRRPLAAVVKDFAGFFRGGGEFVWAQGATFDPPLWEAAAAAVGCSTPWKFWNARDTRTVYDICGLDYKSMPREGVYHNALDDCLTQVKAVAAALSKFKVAA
jgi:hypothetical protein